MYSEYFEIRLPNYKLCNEVIIQGRLRKSNFTHSISGTVIHVVLFTFNISTFGASIFI